MTSEAVVASGFFSRLIVAERKEIPAVIAGFLLFLMLFASYFMLRPVRETFGIAGGVDNLPWLFTGTFLSTLLVVPLYGFAARHVPRRKLLPILYTICAIVMLGFATSLLLDPHNIWVARAFYIWISVMNLFVISIAWSLMADLFSPDQGYRLFGQIAAGASLGGLIGPVISATFIGTLGEAGLLYLSTILLLSTLLCARYLFDWQDINGTRADNAAASRYRIGGTAWGGLALILRSPYLLAISAFMILIAAANTFLYFEQARIVSETFTDRAQQTRVFASIDAVVQSITIFVQIFFTGRLARRLGVTVLLAAAPAVLMLGFGLLSLAATFPILAGVMIVRRVGEYALVRPGREMLFTAVDQETKYKAKNVIDTFVYRGGDALAGWTYTGIVAIASTGAVAVAGAIIAGLWALLGFAIGHRHHEGVIKRGGEETAGG